MIPLCPTSAVPEQDPHVARLPPHRSIILVRTTSGLRVYQNVCPHLGVELGWRGEDVSLDAQHLRCSVHAAVFRREDGLCISGPCQGRALKAVAHSSAGEFVFVDLGDAAE